MNAEVKTFFIVAMVLFSSGGSVLANVVADVSQRQIDFVADFSQGDRSGQSFVAQSTGDLVGIRIAFQAAGFGPDFPAGSDTTIRLRKLRNGIPYEDPLAIGYATPELLSTTEPTWLEILFEEPYYQHRGENLAFMIELASAGANGWNDVGMTMSDPIKWGSHFHADWSEPFAAPVSFTELDLAFETLVDLAGDFNDDGILAHADIDTLLAAIDAGIENLEHDLDRSGSVDISDVFYFAEVIFGTWLGDANLDGEFNSSDFVQLWQASEYEDSIANNSTWADGDWNGDREFDSNDFVLAFMGRGYEAGPRVAFVPEPTSTLGVALLTSWRLAVRRRRMAGFL